MRPRGPHILRQSLLRLQRSVAVRHSGAAPDDANINDNTFGQSPTVNPEKVAGTSFLHQPAGQPPQSPSYFLKVVKCSEM
jgi:hypothetical protein